MHPSVFEPIFDADRIKRASPVGFEPEVPFFTIPLVNGRRIVPSILHCSLSRQILSREQGTGCLARLQNTSTSDSTEAVAIASDGATQAVPASCFWRVR